MSSETWKPSKEGCARPREPFSDSSRRAMQRLVTDWAHGLARRPFPSEDMPRFRWSAVRPGKWREAHSLRLWRGELRREGQTVPVMVKLWPSKREREVLWELRDVPGVPRLLGVTDSFPRALLMEVCPGRSFLCQRRLVNSWTCLAGLQRVCEVAAALHAKGVAHGDLRDRSIIMAETDGTVTVTLLNMRRAVRLGDLDEDGKSEYVLRDLTQLHGLLTQLGDLFCVRAYTNFLQILETRFKDKRPASANQMAAGIACIISLHPHRPFCPFTVLKEVRDEDNTSVSSHNSATDSQPVTTLTLDKSLEWPPRDASFVTFSWSEVSLRPRRLKSKLVARGEKLHRGDSTVPVTIKVSPQEWEQHVLHALQDVPGVPLLLGVIKESPAALVLEDYKGKTFRQLLNTGRVRMCLEGLVHACGTLDALHARGIVHGSLTSRNILIYAHEDTTFATLINLEACCSFRSMQEPWPAVLLHRDLRCLARLVYSLSCLATVPQYRRLRAALLAGLAAGDPMTAKEVAVQLQVVQDHLGGRPWLFGCCRRKEAIHPTPST